jgi:uncharacterized membrane protein
VSRSRSASPALRSTARLRSQRGQDSILLLGVLATLIAVSLVLAAFGQALGGRGRAQRVADLAAISGAHAMREAYPRLFADRSTVGLAFVWSGGVPDPPDGSGQQ